MKIITENKKRGRPKKNKNLIEKIESKKIFGFTLIELLAVIIILGVLMIIAIPSVTEYISDSRKNAYVKTANQYISGARTKVNSAEIPMYDVDATYYLPANCISLEKGGTSPFGEWEEAYIVVTYDGHGYDYYWTSRDSQNMGILLTHESLLNEESIQTGITSLNTSVGIEEREKILLINSCDGNNTTEIAANEVIEEKAEYIPNKYADDINKNANELPILIAKEYNKYFWEYRESIKNIIFENKINIPNDAYKSWDISSTKNNMVVAYIKTNPNDANYYDLYIQGEGRIYANKNSSEFFYGFYNLDSIKNLGLLNTSRVTNMRMMFSEAGRDSEVFKLDLGNNFDTSNVTDMHRMFQNTGYNSLEFTLNLGNKFNTSKVTDMFQMFTDTGYNSKVFKLDLGDKFDTSNVTTMFNMFARTGYNSPIFTLNLGNKFNTSKVEDMAQMFLETGYSSQVFTLNLGDKFDTKNVTNTRFMFAETGYSSQVFTLDLGDKFDTSNVTDMEYMFQQTGYNSPIFTLNLGNKFNTSKVDDMNHMFEYTAHDSKVFTLDLGENFNTSNVTNMRRMFHQTGYESPVFTLNIGDKFDTGKVTDMEEMFSQTGYTSNEFTLDCTNWNVDNVINHNYFGSKVKEPIWKN